MVLGFTVYRIRGGEGLGIITQWTSGAESFLIWNTSNGQFRVGGQTVNFPILFEEWTRAIVMHDPLSGLYAWTPSNSYQNLIVQSRPASPNGLNLSRYSTLAEPWGLDDLWGTHYADLATAQAALFGTDGLIDRYLYKEEGATAINAAYPMQVATEFPERSGDVVNLGSLGGVFAENGLCLEYNTQPRQLAVPETYDADQTPNTWTLNPSNTGDTQWRRESLDGGVTYRQVYAPNGVDQYAELPAGLLDFVHQTGVFNVKAKAKRIANSWGNLNTAGAVNQVGMRIGIDSRVGGVANLRVAVYNGGGAGFVFSLNVDLELVIGDNDWHDIEVRCDGSTLEVLIDGNIEGTTSKTAEAFSGATASFPPRYGWDEGNGIFGAQAIANMEIFSDYAGTIPFDAVNGSSWLLDDGPAASAVVYGVDGAAGSAINTAGNDGVPPKYDSDAFNANVAPRPSATSFLDDTKWMLFDGSQYMPTRTPLVSLLTGATTGAIIAAVITDNLTANNTIFEAGGSGGGYIRCFIDTSGQIVWQTDLSGGSDVRFAAAIALGERHIIGIGNANDGSFIWHNGSRVATLGPNIWFDDIATMNLAVWGAQRVTGSTVQGLIGSLYSPVIQEDYSLAELQAIDAEIRAYIGP